MSNAMLVEMMWDYERLRFEAVDAPRCRWRMEAERLSALDAAAAPRERRAALRQRNRSTYPGAA